MYNQPDEKAKTNERESDDLLRNEGARGNKMQPQQHARWYSRAWAQVRSVFSNKHQGNDAGGISSAEERRYVAVARRGAAVVKPTLTYNKSRYRAIIRGSADGQESHSGEEQSLASLKKRKSKYNHIIGVQGRYGTLDTEDVPDLGGGIYGDIEMTEMDTSGSSVEIADFSGGNVSIGNVKMVKTTNSLNTELANVHGLAKGTGTNINPGDTGSVEVGSSGSAKSASGGDKKGKSIEEIVDRIKTDLAIDDIASTSGFTLKGGIQEDSGTGNSNLSKGDQAVGIGNNVKPSVKFGDIGCASDSSIKSSCIGGGNSIGVVKDRVECKKSIIKVSGGFGGGLVFEKGNFTDGSSFSASGMIDDNSVMKKGIIGGRSAMKPAGLLVGGGLPTSSVNDPGYCHFGGESPARRGHIRIGSSWNLGMDDGGSTSRSPNIGRIGYARLGRIGAVVPDIENANELPDGYVRVGRVRSDESAEGIGNVPCVSTGIVSDGGIVNIGNLGGAGPAINVNAAGETGAGSAKGTADVISVTVGVRHSRWEKDTPLIITSRAKPK